MPARALVLGGGGPVGIAWESGLVAGLEEQGVRLGEADLIVGTSAGSVVGAQLGLGRTGADLLAAQTRQAARPAAPVPVAAPAAAATESGAGPTPAARPAAPDLGPLMRLMAQRPESGEMPLELRRRIGTFALQARTIDEATFIQTMGRAIASVEAGDWPERFMCTAVDAEDGTFIAWTRESGVPLGLAVASSCAVPGVSPPITINGRRYMDGGMRTATNADLAQGHEVVVLVSVTPANVSGGARLRVQDEADALAAAGARVVVVAPDDIAAATFGGNLMDGSQRAKVAEAGLRQGRLEAARLREVWG